MKSEGGSIAADEIIRSNYLELPEGCKQNDQGDIVNEDDGILMEVEE